MPEYVLDTSLAQDRWRQLSPFTRAYVEAAMWTLQGEDGESLDYLGLHDIAEETITAAEADCAAFLNTPRRFDQPSVLELLEATGRDDAQHGHDFWLTRNHHGCGFWDRGYPEKIGERLTEIAQGFGDVDWYLGDDGNVYQM